MSQVEEIYEIVEPLAKSLGLVIWGIDIIGNSRPTIRIFIEGKKEEGTENFTGATIDECAHLSRLVAINLDADDVMPSAYVLEVSSPGLERVFFSLEQLKNYIGQEVDFTLHEANTQFSGRKKFSGTLIAVNEQSFVAEINAEQSEISWDNVKKIKNIYNFPTSNKKIINEKTKTNGQKRGKK